MLFLPLMQESYLQKFGKYNVVKNLFFPRKEKEMRLNCCWSVEGGGELFLLPPSLKCHKKKSNFAVFSNFFFRNLCPWSPSFTYPIKLSLFSPQLFKRKKTHIVEKKNRLEHIDCSSPSLATLPDGQEKCHHHHRHYNPVIPVNFPLWSPPFMRLIDGNQSWKKNTILRTIQKIILIYIILIWDAPRYKFVQERTKIDKLLKRFFFAKTHAFNFFYLLSQSRFQLFSLSLSLFVPCLPLLPSFMRERDLSSTINDGNLAMLMVFSPEMT